MHPLYSDITGIYDLKNKKCFDKFMARKAYLSLLMFLPVNKVTKPLRIKIC